MGEKNTTLKSSQNLVFKLAVMGDSLTVWTTDTSHYAVAKLFLDPQNPRGTLPQLKKPDMNI